MLVKTSNHRQTYDTFGNSLSVSQKV